MTEFSDVHVGDKVRLTAENGFMEGVATEANGREIVMLMNGDEYAAYADNGWSVEVLEPAPKPLPTVRGFYTRPDGTELWKLGVDDLWRQNRAVGWVIAGDNRIPHDLQRLVPVSAVEEARAEVVKEIVAEIVTWLRDESYSSLASRIKNKFIGGKA